MCHNDVYYHIYPPTFTLEGSLEAAADRAEYIASLGVDGVAVAPYEPIPSEEERQRFRLALSAWGLAVEFQEELPRQCEMLHQHCRRDNWEAVPYDPGCAKDLLTAIAQEETPTVYLEGPELPRSVSEMGDQELYCQESAAMLGAVLLTLPGNIFLYQGEELGMVNPPLTLEELKQSEAAQWLSSPQARRRSREELEAKIGRFTRLNARTVPNFRDPESAETLAWYRSLLDLRRSCPALRGGEFLPLSEEHRRAFLYIRKGEERSVLVAANLSGYAAEYDPALERGELLLNNYEGQWVFPGILCPYEVKIFLF